MDKSVKINTQSIKNYGLYLDGSPPIPTAIQETEHIEIRGRHGSLTKKYAYKDIEYPLSFFFYDDYAPFKKSFRQAKLMLFNSERLTFDDDPDVYYKVKSIEIAEAENEVIRFGKFTVNFTLSPFAYEVDNPTQTITSQTTVNNPGYEAEPVMIVHCTGTGKVYVNGEKITIKDINGMITLDSELQNAYRKKSGSIENLNNHMIGDFSVFKHGDNLVRFDGDISKVEITKNVRWV